MSVMHVLRVSSVADYEQLAQDSAFSSVQKKAAGKPDFGVNFGNGTGANNINKTYVATGVSIAAAPLVLDLNGGGLTDIEGNALAFTAIRHIDVHNRNTGVGEILTIGGGSDPVPIFTDAAGDKKPIGPGGSFRVTEPSAAGIGVTAGSADKITLDPGAATIIADIVIAGE